jgi:hypothetical protein
VAEFKRVYYSGRNPQSPFQEAWGRISCFLFVSEVNHTIRPTVVMLFYPIILEIPIEALKFASKIAKGKKFNILLEIEDGIRLYGQNNLAERNFFLESSIQKKWCNPQAT